MRFVSLLMLLLTTITSAAFARDIVLYTSVDEPYVTPLINNFTKETGIKVQLVTDTEATKSVGLVTRLRAEKEHPRCDVWWGNEVFHTITLANDDLLQPYESPSSKDVNEQFKDTQHRWAGCGLRARVIGTSIDMTRVRMRPPTLQFLIDPGLKGRICMANPSSGTTGGHVAALYVLWGNEKADNFFKALRANDMKLLGGNSAVVDQLVAGNFTYGLTDNDDLASAQNDGAKVYTLIPDQLPDADGTLAIPTTVALVRRTDGSEDAKKLVDYLLSKEVEQKLLDAKFVGWSVRAKVTEFRAMKVDYNEVAKALPTTVRRAMDILESK